MGGFLWRVGMLKSFGTHDAMANLQQSCLFPLEKVVILKDLYYIFSLKCATVCHVPLH